MVQNMNTLRMLSESLSNNNLINNLTKRSIENVAK